MISFLSLRYSQLLLLLLLKPTLKIYESYYLAFTKNNEIFRRPPTF